MTLTEKVKKFAVGAAIYCSLAITPVIHKTQIIPEPLKDRTSTTTNLPLAAHSDILYPTIQWPARYSQINQEAPDQKTQPGQQITERKVANHFPLWYKVGDLGYAEDIYYISLDKVVSKTVKEGDTLEKWWRMEGENPAQKKLYQLIFLTINDPSYYPKNFPEGFNLNEQDIKLIIGKKANFLNLDKNMEVLGEIGDYMPLEEVLKITDLKNNEGGLRNGVNRR